LFASDSLIAQRVSGSSDLLKRFRAALKRLVLADGLPDYRLTYDAESDQVTFYSKDPTASAMLVLWQAR
jgi:hypothetical protein